MATAIANCMTIAPTLDRLIAAMSPDALAQMRAFAWESYVRSQEG